MSKFEVGQTVIHVSYIRRGIDARETTVTKVGRKFAYIENGKSFDKETGAETGTAYGDGSYISTVKEYAERENRSRLVGDLRDAGIDLRRGTDFTTAQLEIILAAATTEGEK